MVVRRAALVSTGWIEKQFLADRTGGRLVAFGPPLGWWSAMWNMFSMDSTERRQLIGCAARRGD